MALLCLSCWKGMPLILINFIYDALVKEFAPRLSIRSARVPASNLLQLNSMSLKIGISNGNTVSHNIIRELFLLLHTLCCYATPAHQNVCGKQMAMPFLKPDR